MNNGLKKVIVFCIIILILLFLIWHMGFHRHLTIHSLQENRGYLESTVATNYPKSVFIYLLIYAGIITFAIPGVPILTMLGGFLFGFIPGGFYALIGASVGTSLSFLIMRHIFSNVIRGKYAQKLEQFNEKLKIQGVASYLLTMHLVGLIPYFIINSLAALADVPFITFFWTTIVGSLPIIFIYSFAGRQLYFIETFSDIFSPTIIMLLVLLIIMGLVPLFLRKARHDVVS
jgi:uncharacterized membrane protein YdjX (TVP38/TMEM64 family)